MDPGSPWFDISDTVVHQSMEENKKGGYFLPNLQDQNSVEEFPLLGTPSHCGPIW